MRRPGRLILLVSSAVSVFLLVELAARALEPALEEPNRWPDEATATKARQMARLGCADVVFVGNSTARDAFDPRVFESATAGELVAYNAALDAAGPGLVADWLDDAVLAELDPAVVVWALGSPDLNDAAPGTRAAHEAYRASVAGRTDTLGSVQRVAWDRLALVRNREALREVGAVADAVGPGARPDGGVAATALLDDRGLGLSRRDLRYEPGDPAVRSFVAAQLLANHTVGPEQTDRAGALLDDLSRRGHRVVLVVLPVTDELRALHPGGAASWHAYRKAVDDLAEQAGLRLVDLADAVEPDGFADLHHVNARGSRQVTEAVARALDDPVDADRAVTTVFPDPPAGSSDAPAGRPTCGERS
jgi:lysophospholipase L1-like esterase